MSLYWKACSEFPVLVVRHTCWWLFIPFTGFNGSKYAFQLTAYLSGDIPPQAIMLEIVITDKDVDPVAVVSRSPLRLPGFRSDAFSIIQLLGTYCPSLVVPSHIESSSPMDVASMSALPHSRKRKRPLTPHQFEHFLCDVSRWPRCVSPPPSPHNSLTAIDIFSFEVSLRASEGMKLAGEEMLFNADEMHADLYSRYRDVVDKVMML
ncbi:unnamed protein product [Lactuca virosa]|uniref:Uncharacterized protein n=1 Tax=Lactuca virosa TaxID=75947 RepID=A0AAU9MWD3_9ASTR|nr:unnamed protein product [Lactuca virosa]